MSINQATAAEPQLPSGQWNGFYLESHQPRRGWMSLFMEFANGQIRGEGTDYVGPWTATGRYDVDTKQCGWTKQYVGKHQVDYVGEISERGIYGRWKIFTNSGEFHIWPRHMTDMDEVFLKQDLEQPMVPTDPFETKPRQQPREY